MPQWLSNLIEQSNAFIPHGHCFLWLPGLLWMHVVSDTLIGLAYVGISLILYLFVRKIRLPFSPLFIAFGLFIGLCGLTHFMAVWTVWNPDYWVSGAVKAATAAASVATAIGLFFIRPQVEEVVHAARLSEERRAKLETTHAELQAMYAKVKEVDELKMQFFANVSHELRTPLSLVLGPVEQLLQQPDLAPAQRQKLESVERNGRILLKQVNDLLDVAKLEEGQVPVNYRRLDLAATFRELTEHFRELAEQRGIRYEVEAPPGLQGVSDPDMLERIVINLLSNAFKFCPDGGAVRVRLAGEDDALRLWVEDSGPGVSESQRKLIFERFRQADGGATRKHGGTGLGLAIARDFVRLLGGEIDVDSGELGGARFHLRLPLRPPEGETVDAAVTMGEGLAARSRGAVDELRSTAIAAAEDRDGALADDAGKPAVLVVEDSGELRAFISEILRPDYRVIGAPNGAVALEEARALLPDLIITDIMMPEMSGDQLVAALRGEARFDTVPILLLSAKADDELRVRLLREGAQDYLTKPFLAEELQARAANLVNLKRGGDALRAELSSSSLNLRSLADELAFKHRQLQVSLQATEAAREQAEQASQVKSHFLGLISHEMRTPLSNISMNAELIEQHLRKLPAEAAKAPLQRLLRSARQLTGLIEGVLQYTRVESGKADPHPQPVDVRRLAAEVMAAVGGQLSPSGVELRLDDAEAGESPLLTDEALLRVVLHNLLSNALKFTSEGQVTLRLKAVEGGRVFEVEDTGIGIAERDLERIFLPFEQLEPLKRKNIPGVGLGLALTKEIVEQLGGRVEVSSEQGRGSCFRIMFPEDLRNNKSNDQGRPS